MTEFSEKGASGRLYAFMGLRPAFAEMNEDQRMAELARHEPSDHKIAARMRREARQGRVGLGSAIMGRVSGVMNTIRATLNPRRMP